MVPTKSICRWYSALFASTKNVSVCVYVPGPAMNFKGNSSRCLGSTVSGRVPSNWKEQFPPQHAVQPTMRSRRRVPLSITAGMV